MIEPEVVEQILTGLERHLTRLENDINNDRRQQVHFDICMILGYIDGVRDGLQLPRKIDG